MAHVGEMAVFRLAALCRFSIGTPCSGCRTYTDDSNMIYMHTLIGIRQIIHQVAVAVLTADLIT